MRVCSAYSPRVSAPAQLAPPTLRLPPLPRQEEGVAHLPLRRSSRPLQAALNGRRAALLTTRDLGLPHHPAQDCPFAGRLERRAIAVTGRFDGGSGAGS